MNKGGGGAMFWLYGIKPETEYSFIALLLEKATAIELGNKTLSKF